MLAINVIKEKLDDVIAKADVTHMGEVAKNEHWCFKLKYAHCWNLEQNWKNGQFLRSEEVLNTAEDYEHIRMLSTCYSTCRAKLYRQASKSEHNMDVDSVILEVVDISPTHLVLVGLVENNSRICTKLVNKNSLEVLAECTHGNYDSIANLVVSALSDTILIMYDGEVLFVKFQLNDPKIWLERVGPNLAEKNSLESLNGDYLVTVEPFKLEVHCYNMTNSELCVKVWELDISEQNSFPKIKFSSAFVNFPFVFATKSNGLLEVWEVTKDELVKTVDKTEVLHATGDLRSTDMLMNEIEKVLCLVGDAGGMMVLDGKLLKRAGTDIPVAGYQLQDDTKYRTSEVQMDSTCITYLKDGLVSSTSFLCKLDFWPIFPANFTLKIDRTKVEDEQRNKPKKRKASYTISDAMTGKKTQVEIDPDDSDREDDYDYKNNDVDDYGGGVDDDHEQFYDDDNDDDYY